MKNCHLKISSSYGIPLVIIEELETESVMNDWILGENLSSCPEPESEIDKYAVAVTKGARVIGHLKKGKTGRYAKTFFLLPVR